MQPRELTIRTRHLTFAALEMGDPEGHPVLALHGWLDNAASFIPVSAHLQSIRLIAIDLAGHGLSDHRPQGWSYDVWHYVEDLVDIVDALQLKSFGLIGHSLGGVICTMAAATVFRDQLTAMVLIDGISPLPRRPDQAPESLLNYIQLRRTPVSELPVSRYRSVKQAIRARAIGMYRVSRQSSELLVARGLRETDGEWVWTADARLKLGSPVRFTREQSLAFVKAVMAPVRMIYARNGELSSFIVQNQGEMPHICFHSLEGTHHLHMDDQVEEVASIVNATLG